MSNKTSMAVFFGFWLLGISVLIYGYSSLIVTSLTVPAMNPAINTLEDLLTSRAVSIVIRPEMYMGQKILV